jgi:cytochrome c biogenesis protein CcmG/thiol:disulfide interchange protein DsbE
VKPFVALMCMTWAALAGAVELGSPAPDFTLTDGAGNVVRLSDFRGKQAVYLDFWASWCIPCRKSFPWMNELQARHPNLKIIAVNLDERRQDADKFLAAVPARFSVVYDPRSGVGRAYDLKAMPASFLIDRQGVLRLVHKGFREDDAPFLEQQFSAVIGAAK